MRLRLLAIRLGAVLPWVLLQTVAAQAKTAIPSQAKAEIKSWRKNGPAAKSVDVLFVGDGYTRERKRKFLRDVERYTDRLLKEPPFSWYKDRFNVRSAFVASADRGCDLSPTAQKADTLLESHFDSPRGRLLVFRNRRTLRRIVAQAGDVDIVFVMVDTEKYGGAGTLLRAVRVRGRPLAAPTFAAQDTASFMIAVHELGHSFADLADEYVDKNAAKVYALPRGGTDLRQANVTRLGQFDARSKKTFAKTVKWKHLLVLPGARKKKWLHEGAYYREKGVFRPWRDCKMRRNAARFCPVCMEQMAKAIVLTCGQKWNPAAYHKLHPLRLW
jgi:IgA Peptidase M64